MRAYPPTSTAKLRGTEGEYGQGKEKRKEVLGEEGETKEVTLATAFSRRAREPESVLVLHSQSLFLSESLFR